MNLQIWRNQHEQSFRTTLQPTTECFSLIAGIVFWACFFFCRVDSLEQLKVRLSIYFSIGGHTTTALCSSTMRYQVLFSAPIIPHHLLHSRFNTHTSLHSNLYTNAAPGNVVWSQMYHQMRLRIDIWDICSNLCDICICRRQQLNKMPGRNVLYGATQKKLLQRSWWVFLQYQIFFVIARFFPLSGGKIHFVPEKNDIYPEKISQKNDIYWEGKCTEVIAQLQVADLAVCQKETPDFFSRFSWEVQDFFME